MTEKLDVYSRVTNKIMADLERGNLTWLQPWQADTSGAGITTACAPEASLTVASMC